MRTTLDLDPDVLQAAKELAELRRSTAGKVISELARLGLQRRTEAEPRMRNGVPLLLRREPGAPPMTMERVNELRDELP